MIDLRDEKREAWVVGALLHDHKLDTVEASQGFLDAVNLTPEDFANRNLGKAFTAAEALLRQGRPSTPADVAEVLTKDRPGALNTTTGWLRDLRDTAITNRQALVTHARQLKKLFGLRKTEAFLREQLRALPSCPDLNTVALDLTAFGSGLSMSARGYRSASEDVTRIAEAQDAVQLGERSPVVPTGIELLDTHIQGFRSTLNVIAGAPGIGKSALMATVLENISNGLASRNDDSRVGLFALEDGSEAITSRIVAKHSGLSWGAIGAARLSGEQLGRFQDGCAVAHAVMDRVEKFEPVDGEAVTASQVVALARDWVLNRQVRIVFLDHLGELEPEDNDREKHYLRVRAMVKELRSIAVRYSVPVVVLHHLNREAQRSTGGRPQLYHLAESEYLGRMARLVLGLWPGQTEDDLNLSILKQTRGPSGNTMGNRVLVLKRLKEAAMVCNSGGASVDLSVQGDVHGAR